MYPTLLGGLALQGKWRLWLTLQGCAVVINFWTGKTVWTDERTTDRPVRNGTSLSGPTDRLGQTDWATRGGTGSETQFQMRHSAPFRLVCCLDANGGRLTLQLLAVRFGWTLAQTLGDAASGWCGCGWECGYVDGCVCGCECGCGTGLGLAALQQPQMGAVRG